jgi:hypothetical protein
MQFGLEAQLLRLLNSRAGDVVGEESAAGCRQEASRKQCRGSKTQVDDAQRLAGKTAYAGQLQQLMHI